MASTVRGQMMRPQLRSLLRAFPLSLFIGQGVCDAVQMLQTVQTDVCRSSLQMFRSLLRSLCWHTAQVLLNAEAVSSLLAGDQAYPAVEWASGEAEERPVPRLGACRRLLHQGAAAPCPPPLLSLSLSLSLYRVRTRAHTHTGTHTTQDNKDPFGPKGQYGMWMGIQGDTMNNWGCGMWVCGCVGVWVGACIC